MSRRCTLEFVRTDRTATSDRIVFYPTPQWYWRFIAANGKETGRASETYRNRIDCIRSAELTTGCYFVRSLESQGFCWRAANTDPTLSAYRVNVRWIR